MGIKRVTTLEIHFCVKFIFKNAFLTENEGPKNLS